MAGVLNLCFHGIGSPQRELEPEEERYWISPERFEAMLARVRGNPAVRVSFDDGNASDVELALPALRHHGLTATFFLVAGRIGAPGCVDEAGVRALCAAGMTIGSHGARHRPWRHLERPALHEELVDARARLAAAAGRSVDVAACPFGAYDRRVLAAVRAAGFRQVFTVDGGPARPGAWLQTRYTVQAGDDPDRIQALARGTGAATVTRTVKSAVKRWR
jgi:peptidoglycan/xylan/chitin deacetylase (PgdA/CDA1 family)